MPRILLLGAGGQLGMLLKRRLSIEGGLTALGRTELDLADPDAIRSAIQDADPEILVNAAAYTAVDRAEQEQELARLVNATAPGVMAEEMKRRNGWMVHYSTDYVFDGSGVEPWSEIDTTGPLNVYGRTKLDGELAVAAAGGRHVILRTSWVYAAEGKNFLHTMLRLGREREQLRIVDDQIGAPTSAEAITTATAAILDRLRSSADADNLSGVYHLTCSGATSWCGFAKAIFDEFALHLRSPEVIPIPTSAYPTPARRPLNSRLNCEKLAGELGVRMPEWLDALHQVANKLLAEHVGGSMADIS